MLAFMSALACSWVLNAATISSRNRYYYYVNETICDNVLPRFFEDSLLTWRRITCPDVHTLIRNAFDEWQHNTPDVSFYETPLSDGAHISISADFVSGTSTVAQWNPVEAVIHIDESTCWYTDREFCATVAGNLVPIWVTTSLVWAASLALGLYFVCRRSSRVDTVARIVTWSVFLSCPIVLFSAVYPCTRCFDFKYTMMHEVGHTLGFGHTNAEGQHCGCGENATACVLTDADARATIMHSDVQRTALSCLSRNDVDGLRSKFGPANGCEAPVWCYQQTSLAGPSRVAVAMVYGFVMAWLFVFVRRVVYDRCFPSKRIRRVIHLPSSAVRRYQSRRQTTAGHAGNAVHDTTKVPKHRTLLASRV